MVKKISNFAQDHRTTIGKKEWKDQFDPVRRKHEEERLMMRTLRSMGLRGGPQTMFILLLTLGSCGVSVAQFAQDVADKKADAPPRDKARIGVDPDSAVAKKDFLKAFEAQLSPEFTSADKEIMMRHAAEISPEDRTIVATCFDLVKHRAAMVGDQVKPLIGPAAMKENGLFVLPHSAQGAEVPVAIESYMPGTHPSIGVNIDLIRGELQRHDASLSSVVIHESVHCGDLLPKYDFAIIGDRLTVEQHRNISAGYLEYIEPASIKRDLKKYAFVKGRIEDRISKIEQDISSGRVFDDETVDYLANVGLACCRNLNKIRHLLPEESYNYIVKHVKASELPSVEDGVKRDSLELFNLVAGVGLDLVRSIKYTLFGLIDAYPPINHIRASEIAAHFISVGNQVCAAIDPAMGRMEMQMRERIMKRADERLAQDPREVEIRAFEVRADDGGDLVVKQKPLHQPVSLRAAALKKSHLGSRSEL